MIFQLFLFVLICGSALSFPTETGNGESNNVDWSNKRFVIMSNDNGEQQIVDLTRNARKLTITPDDVTLYLYTDNNPDDPEVITKLNIQELKESKHYDPKKTNVFIIHGWVGTYDSPATTTIKDALVDVVDVNIFIVDWSGIAKKFYLTAKNAIPDIAKLLAQFVEDMYATYNLTGDNFRLIGHSLGAHLAGCTGKLLNGEIDYILGLDPAGPGYSANKVDVRLDKTDAKFVQVIHTNGGMLGYKGQLGHADYYPNGGNKQPGCGLDALGSCAHSRSFKYLAESMHQSDFHANECDNFDDYEKGICLENNESFMGQFHINYNAHGKYYLKTASQEPFALGPYRKDA